MFTSDELDKEIKRDELALRLQGQVQARMQAALEIKKISARVAQYEETIKNITAEMEKTKTLIEELESGGIAQKEAKKKKTTD